jgi:hypothetical protein
VGELKRGSSTHTSGLSSWRHPEARVFRSQVDARTLTTPISTALREASGGLRVAQIRLLEEIEAANIAGRRLNMLLLTLFGFAGLLLTAIGV